MPEKSFSIVVLIIEYLEHVFAQNLFFGETYFGDT